VRTVLALVQLMMAAGLLPVPSVNPADPPESDWPLDPR